MKVTVSAPGKAILMGEHAAVYGRPALVAAVDQRLEAELSEIEDGEVCLQLPEVAVSETASWASIRAYTRRARKAWQEYADEPNEQTFGRLRGDDPAHLVKVALGEVGEYLGETEATGLELRLSSQIPIGAGFGSSAAVAVAIIQAYASLRGADLPKADLERLSLEAERRQHGTPSGIDSTTVIHGGLIWALRDPEGRFTATPIRARSETLAAIRVFNTGTPAESTGGVVAAVRGRREADPVWFSALLDRMEAATREVRRILEQEAEAPDQLVGPMRDFEACLEAIGVVPAPVRDIVKQVEGNGGAAKISGAGALSGTRAGSLLVTHPEPQRMDSWTFLDELERLDVGLGSRGSRVVVAADS